MAKFTDYTGQEWTLRLTVYMVAQIRSETGINLALVSKDRGWVNQIFGDERDDGKLASILFLLCEQQCQQAKLSPEQFAQQLDGPTLEAAGQALVEAIADFFPSSSVAQALKKSLGQVRKAAEEKAVAAIEAATLTACASLMNAPVSSASIPSP
jgi:hypothetical protein